MTYQADDRLDTFREGSGSSQPLTHDTDGNLNHSPQLKRFITQDPIGCDGGWHLYAYAAGNPVVFFDPLRFAFEEVLLAVTDGIVAPPIQYPSWNPDAITMEAGFTVGSGVEFEAFGIVGVNAEVSVLESKISYNLKASTIMESYHWGSSLSSV